MATTLRTAVPAALLLVVLLQPLAAQPWTEADLGGFARDWAATLGSGQLTGGADLTRDGYATHLDAVEALARYLGRTSPTLSGSVDAIHFVVGPGDIVPCQGNVTVHCMTADIAGLMYSLPSTVPGQSGGNIVIDAQGAVVVSGRIRAGNGAGGSDAPTAVSAPDDPTNGGAGGSVLLLSASGNISVESGAQLWAGHGSSGGTSYTGGAGGRGGDVVLSAPVGTVTIQQSPGMIQKGDGGDGGMARVPEADRALAPDPVVCTGTGGEGGDLLVESTNLQGLASDGALPDIAYAFDDVGAIFGGAGGDGGDVLVGDPEESGTAATAQTAGAGRVSTAAAPSNPYDYTTYPLDKAADGGAGNPGGKGGSIGTDSVLREAWVGREGGRGGAAKFEGFYTAPGYESVPMLRYQGRYQAGHGGAAWAKGGSRTSLLPGGCAPGDQGYGAVAKGGRGGDIPDADLPIRHVVGFVVDLIPGTGGQAWADAGRGSDAGDCCSPPGPGKNGGIGGEVAYAQGGAGGSSTHMRGGDGGAAEANGAYGGDGGKGAPPGMGGACTPAGLVTAISGAGGNGVPKGSSPEPKTANGRAGNDGAWCPSKPTRTVVLTGKKPRHEIGAQPNLLMFMNQYLQGYYWVNRSGSSQQTAATSAQAGGTVDTATLETAATLGGQLNQLWPVGKGYLECSSKTIWVTVNLAESGAPIPAIYRYNAPLQGDRPPDMQITGANLGFYEARGLWTDSVHDRVYACVRGSAFPNPYNIAVWDGAFALTGTQNRNYDRLLSAGDAYQFLGITGDATRDVIYAFRRVDLTLGPTELVAYDGASTLANGAGPTRTINWPTGVNNATDLAYDAEKDILYVLVASMTPRQVLIYRNASTLSGDVTPQVLNIEQEASLSAPIGIVCLADADILLMQANTAFVPGPSVAQFAAWAAISTVSAEDTIGVTQGTRQAGWADRGAVSFYGSLIAGVVDGETPPW